MTVKPAVFALLAVAGLGAAGVGGYLAVNSAVPPAQAPAVATAPATPAVSETEAIVSPADGTVGSDAGASTATPVERPASAAATSAARVEPSRTASRRAAEPVEAPRARTPAAAGRDAHTGPPAPVAARPTPAPAETRPTPAPPVMARDEAPRPGAEPVRDPGPLTADASREPSRPIDDRPVVDTPPAPRAEEFVVPADSVIGLRLEDTISSDTARVEQRVEARVTRDVRVNGTTVIPAGTRARGEVTLVETGGRFKERARLGVRFHTLVLADGSTVPIDTETVYREGDEVGKKAATRIGASAVGGAIVGAIFGGGRGAAIGAAAGAGAGTAATAASDRSQATLPSGSTVTVRLTGPAVVTLEP